MKFFFCVLLYDYGNKQGWQMEYARMLALQYEPMPDVEDIKLSKYADCVDPGKNNYTDESS